MPSTPRSPLDPHCRTSIQALVDSNKEVDEQLHSPAFVRLRVTQHLHAHASGFPRSCLFRSVQRRRRLIARSIYRKPNSCVVDLEPVLCCACIRRPEPSPFGSACIHPRYRRSKRHLRINPLRTFGSLPRESISSSLVLGLSTKAAGTQDIGTTSLRATALHW